MQNGSRKPDRLAVAACTLSLVSLFMIPLMLMALTDIVRGEGNLTLEYWVARASVLVIVASQITSLAAFWRRGEDRKPNRP